MLVDPSGQSATLIGGAVGAIGGAAIAWWQGASGEEIAAAAVGGAVFGAMMGHKTPKPVIGLVNWSGGGGHFVLIDKITMMDKHLKMCVCDPWDGCVHVIGAPLGGAMPYRPTYGFSEKTSLVGGVATGFTAGGNHSIGDFNGWLVTFDA